MPETALGLFPDIGASYFLSRLPGFYGRSFLSLFWNHIIVTCIGVAGYYSQP